MNTATPIRVLLVEDRADDAELVLRELRRNGISIEPRRVQARGELERALEEFQPQLILSDYTLPGYSGIDALRTASAQSGSTPFIFVSGTIGEERAIEALKQGAVDYVLKDNLARLVPAVQRALRDAADREARQLAQRRLEESEARFRASMEFSPIGMALLSPEGRFLAANPALCRIVGYEADELLARDFQSITHPEDLAADLEFVRQILAREIETFSMHKRYLRKDGRIVWGLVTAALVRRADDEPQYFVAQVQDISDQLSAERALRTSEERFRLITDATQEWIWEIDAQGIYVFCSPAIEAILGYTPDEVVGKDALHVVTQAAGVSLAERLRDAAAARRAWRDVVLRVAHKDGSTRWLENSAVPRLDARGELVGYRGVSRDITERRRQEEKIARLSRFQVVLGGINSTILRVANRAELMRESCRLAVQRGGFQMAWMGLMEEGNDPDDPLSWVGTEFDETHLAAQTEAAIRAHRADVGRALRENSIVVADELADHASTPFVLHELGAHYRSLAVLPLQIDQRAVGVLVLFAYEKHFFDREELNLLRELAGDVSFALEYLAKAERVTYLSYYDAVTGLANRELFFDRVTQAIATAKLEGRQQAVLTTDLQRFYSINDTLGRSGADRVLQQLARRIEDIFGDAATPARIGGGRFAVTVPELPGRAMARWLEESILDALAAPFAVNGDDLRTTVRIGIALYPADGESAETLVAAAEAALTRASDATERFVFYSPEMNVRVAEHLQLESRLRKAVEERQFVMYYQPKLALLTREVVGLEALIRWRDPAQGIIPPVHFIPLLEESGLIIEVGEWIFEQVLADAATWRASGIKVPPIAVNVSQVQLRHKRFVQNVLDIVGPAADRAAMIDLEVTESLSAQDVDANIEHLSELRAAGMRIFMDDFGTGYSSLSQITQLPLDALKIDRAFVSGMSDSSRQRAIVSTVVNLSKSLGIFVVAEGVETEAQAMDLYRLGCDEAQGYLFSTPLPPEEVVGWLRRAAIGPV